MVISLSDVRQDLDEQKDLKKAKILQRFFKTGKGEYGEGDIFYGLTVPESRKLAIKYRDLSFEQVRTLLKSKIHEERLVALLILVHNFVIGSDEERGKIFNYYLQNTQYINNWDLVDLSAEKIVGAYLLGKDKKILFDLARSQNLWERRIAIIATYYYIKEKDCTATLRIAEILISDQHDLIQKAVGWMLREVGKRCSAEVEEKFLRKHYKIMPRTMLRYAIERLPEKLRKSYLTGSV